MKSIGMEADGGGRERLQEEAKEAAKCWGILSYIF